MKTKRFLAALLAAIMTFTCLGVVAFAELPASAQYNDNMDGYTDTWPANFKDRTNKGLRTSYQPGVSGASTDKAWCWCIGVGNGGTNTSTDPEDMLIGPTWSYGITIPLGAEIMNETVVFDCDFKFGSKTIWAPVVRPMFGATIDALTVKGDELVIQSIGTSGTHTIKSRPVKKVICEMVPGTWYNLGAVITHSSSTGVTIDYYVDSEKVYTYTDAALKANALTSFDTFTSAYTVAGDPGRFDTRGENIYMDNLYIGSDLGRVTPNFWINAVTPAEGSTVPVDQDFSVVLNQAAANVQSVPNAMWLRQKDGTIVNFKNIVNEKTNVDKDTITGQLGEKLFYSEEYTLNQSTSIINSSGRNLEARAYTYKTKSMFPVTAKVNYTKSAGTATAALSFNGNSTAMKLIMASYDKDGVMVDSAVRDVAAYDNNASISVSYLNDETIKIFAVDGIDTANLVMEPIIDGAKAKSYKQENTTISLEEATKANQVISVEGSTDSVRGWVVAKIAEKGKETSANIADYLTFDAVQANDNGSFKFAGKIKKTEGVYTYKATAADSKNSDSGEVEYILGTGTDILSFKLDGKNCLQDGNTFYLKLKNKDASGLLVEFALPYKATLLCNGKVLTSGKSRINCDDVCVLEVKPEFGESKFYNVIVDVQITDDYDDRNDNLTVIGGESKNEGEDVVDPGEWEDPTRVFTDVPKSHWAMEAIEGLYERGVVGGVGNGKFAPNQLITREEFASMVAKAFNFNPKNQRISFDDVPWGAWYESSVYALAENGIVSGIEKHKFGVGQTITRQDMAVILYNVIKDGSVEYIRDYKDFADQSKIAGYAKEAVKVMYEAGFISGMEDGTFAPTAGTTKAMAAYMIYSILNK